MTPSLNAIQTHTRVNDILLGPLERPALRWLAAHMPAWVSPDRLTVIGVLGAAIILLGYLLSAVNPGFLWLASAGFVANWFGDSLDGTLARFRHIEKPKYGFFVDHTTDAVGQVMIFLGLGLTPHVSFTVASLALIAYLILSVLAYVRTCVAGEFKISYGRLGPTEIRVLAILLNTAMLAFGVKTFTIPFASGASISVSPYDMVVSGIALLLLSFFITSGLREARRLASLGE